MSLNKDTATERAKEDLATRVGAAVGEIEIRSIDEKDFPDMSLGAPADGEMSASMISSGWVIVLSADEKSYEYRADKYQLRLVDFEGTNHVIVS